MKTMGLSSRHLEALNAYRAHLDHGDNTTQENLDKICWEFEKYRETLRPNEKDESFALVDREGNLRQLSAPRWLCHLLNLRHRSVHVLLRWWSPSLGNVFVLQVRSWTKSDSPGHLDISVGGHVLGTDVSSSTESAYREMEEELGLTKDDLKSDKLIFLEGYESTDICEADNFYNTEWRDLYLGEISTSSLDKIRFNDKEVVGLYLCPVMEAKRLLNQNIIPVASALRFSLPKCL